MKTIRTAVIGVGHMGKEHARVYHNMPDVELVGIAELDEKRGKKVARKCRTQLYADYRDLMGKVDAVSIAVPTSHHYSVAKDFIERGVAVLVEKPMTKSVAEAEELVELARRKGVIVQVGHIERFNPALVAIQNRLKAPKFIECHRLSPFSFRSADIGVVFDLMIHDIDIILHLMQSEIKRIDAAGASVISRHEDVANARILFRNGCVANVTASRVSLKTMRKIRIFEKDCYISIDCLDRKATVIRKSPKLTVESIDVEKIDASTIADLKGFLFGDLLKIEKIKMDDYEPLQRELEAFINSVRNNEPPVVSGEDGLKAVKTAASIVDEINKTLIAAHEEPIPAHRAGYSSTSS